MFAFDSIYPLFTLCLKVGNTKNNVVYF